MLSGMVPTQTAPAQTTAPVQQVPAPVQPGYVQPAYAQGSVQLAYAQGYAPVVAQSGSASIGPSYRAIALGWNSGGGWVVRTSPTLATASLDALRTCNNQFGECSLADAVVAPTAFGCMVVAQSADDTGHLFAAVGDTLDLARASADSKLTEAGTHGPIVYTGCNA